MKALAFGEILWDVYPEERFIGGAPFNFAAHLARHGAEVYALSAVGNDSLGRESLTELAKLGVRDRYVTVSNTRPTGQCLVSLEKGVPSYRLLEDVAYDDICWPGSDEGFDLLYFGSLALRSGRNLQTLKRLLAEMQFAEVFVDVNLRPPFFTRETVNFCLANATLLKISGEELPGVLELLELTPGASREKILAALAQRFENLKLILLTLGSEGAVAWDCAAKEALFCPARKVAAVSTVGAGDSFSAAFAARYFQGESLGACLAHAARVAGFVVAHRAAVPDYDPQTL